jgi:hypothetical protein
VFLIIILLFVILLFVILLFVILLFVIRCDSLRDIKANRSVFFQELDKAVFRAVTTVVDNFVGLGLEQFDGRETT